jgi:hypothetical protein
MSALAVSEASAERRHRAKLRLVKVSETEPTSRDLGWAEGESQPFVLGVPEVSGGTPSAVTAGDPWQDTVLDGVNRINMIVSASLADFAPEPVVASGIQPNFSILNEAHSFDVFGATLQAFQNQMRPMLDQMQPVLDALSANAAALRTMAGWQVTPFLPTQPYTPGLLHVPASALSPFLHNYGAVLTGAGVPSELVQIAHAPAITAADAASAIATEEQEHLDATDEDPPAYRAFCQLRRWLSLSARETAEMLGLGYTTPYTWKRENREPQPANARAVYQHHALVEAIVQRLGEPGAQSWLHSGSPSPFDLLVAGDIEAATNAAQQLIFGTPASRPEPSAVYDEEAEEPSSTASGGSPRPRRAATRRIRRSST